MSDRAPGKLYNTLHTKPWFHSGSVRIGQLLHSDQSYSSSGLDHNNYKIRIRSTHPGLIQKPVPIMPKKPNPYTDKGEVNYGWLKLDFKEYNFVKQNDVYITIVHCDNCEQHNITTRHDPVKYAEMAQKMKSAILTRYPMCKVIIRPLSQLNPEVANGRLGAFEIQLCNYESGIKKVNVIFSKLISKRWPVIDDTLLQISEFLPKCQLFITVFENSNTENYIKGLTVRVKPRSTPINSDFIRPKTLSAQQRPQSATIKKSVSRPGTAQTQRGGLRVMSRPTSAKQAPSKQKQQSYEKVTDRDGCCLFSTLPLDIYEIEIKESREYKGAMKILNTFEEQQQTTSFNIYIGVQSKKICNIMIRVMNQSTRELLNNALVRAKNQDGETYGFPLINQGSYEHLVPFGEYVVSVFLEGYQDFSQQLQVFQSDLTIYVELEPHLPRQINVYTYEALSADPVGAAQLFLRTQQSHMQLEGLTRQGHFAYNIDQRGTYTIRVVKSEFLNSTKELFIGHNKEVNIFIPMVQSNSRPDISLALLSWTRQSDDLELFGISQQDTISYKNPQGAEGKLFDYLKSHGISTLMLYENCRNWVRIVVKILSQDLIENPNALIETGLSFNIYCKGRFIASITPPPMQGVYWDIGAIKPDTGDFIETNVLVWENIENPICHLNDFQSLIYYIQTRNESISNIFNFQNSGIEKASQFGYDKYISQEIFKRQVQQLVSDQGFEYIIAGLKDSNGISLTRLQKRYERYKEVKATKPLKQQTIEAYARVLGVDPIKDSQYMWIVEEGLKAPIPKDWEMFTDSQGNVMYRNTETGAIQQDHPNDEIYKQKILQAKITEQPIIEPEEQSQNESEAQDIEEALQEVEDRIEELSKIIIEETQIVNQRKAPPDFQRKDFMLQDVTGLIDYTQELKYQITEQKYLKRLQQYRENLDELYEVARSYGNFQDVQDEERQPVPRRAGKQSSSSDSDSYSDSSDY